MNAEVIKAINKKESKIDAIRKWWRKNGYKVVRVVLFPIWGAVVAKEKFSNWKYKRLEWSEERANEILSYYIPRKSEWDNEDKTFYFADNGMGWSMKCRQKAIKLKDRAWWKKFTGGWGGQVRTYLLEKFELEGFTKEVGDTSYFWTEVCFRMIEK